MNSLIPWNPFKEIDELQNRFAKAFAAAPTRTGNGAEELMTVAEWTPSVDRSEEHTSELQSPC